MAQKFTPIRDDKRKPFAALAREFHKRDMKAAEEKRKQSTTTKQS